MIALKAARRVPVIIEKKGAPPGMPVCIAGISFLLRGFVWKGEKTCYWQEASAHLSVCPRAKPGPGN
jgi:hypothetical protein